MGMKPDRLVTLVENYNTGGMIFKTDVLTLLRRAQRAQRARVVKIVKDELAYRCERYRDLAEVMDVSGMAACKSILAKLHGRTP